MKFYIISIVLNVMALFIPVAYYVSNNNEKENKKNEPITINLSESVFTNVSDVPEGVAGNKNNGEENDKSVNDKFVNNERVKDVHNTKNIRNSEKIEISQNDGISNSRFESNSKKISNLNDQKEIKYTEKVLQKNEDVKVVSKEKAVDTTSTPTNISKNVSENTVGNNQNDSHINKTRTNIFSGEIGNHGDVVNKNVKSDSFVKKLGNDGNSGKDGSNRGNINRKAEDSGSSKVRNLEKISKKSSKNDDNEQKRNNEKDKEKNINVCNEGKDFTVSYNPNLSYPIAARRLGNKGVVTVSVKFHFNSSGSVSVISVSGGNSIFQQEARKAASKIRVKIKNPEILKCTISKSFEFELK
ncbi:TonB family domain protein [Leptotrichia wadei]|uniref:TonB family domain protein n=1 Tax=Leptotrichia wadei TaxID=157687 RepID=A0A510KQS8_9FUSO|nr:TonB family protein [Leptotrichia wadei]BBM53984.1 TonB family domain protein [Leptotrichia wadei]